MADPKIKYDIEAAVSGDADVNRLAKELEQLDGSLSPALAERAQLTVQRLRELGAEKAAIDRFGELKAASEAAGTKLQEAQQQAQDFARSLASTAAPTRAQTGQLEKLRDAVNAAEKELQKQTAALDDSRAALTRAGIPIEGLSKKQAELRKEIANSIIESPSALGSTAIATNVFRSRSARPKTHHIASPW
ncbi:MAG: hypothetical protein IPG93_24705 [Burkholderiales bacterium]|nr:hypothetical protein [Burkholderiales bacterium]